MANLSCFVCGDVFLEWDSVTCDGCTRTTHRETCGDYEIVVRDDEPIAYYFCNLCADEPDPVLEWDEDEWGPQ